MIILNDEGKRAFDKLQHSTSDILNSGRKSLGLVGRYLYTLQREKMSEKKTGRFYKYKGRIIRASSQGEYPAVRSGHLKKSLGYQVYGNETLLIGSRSDEKYPTFVELKKSNFGGRSYLKKSVDENKTELSDIINKNIYAELKK